MRPLIYQSDAERNASMTEIAKSVEAQLPPGHGFLLTVWDGGEELVFAGNTSRRGILSVIRAAADRLEDRPA